jgi:vacuolar-type H+-ATPase subunit E/Vma4
MTTVLGDPEALAADVIRRAQLKAVRITEEAKRRAASIQNAAEEESTALRRRSEEATEKQITALSRRNAARAEMEARRRLAQLREEPIQNVWASTEEQLRKLVEQPAYLDVLKHLALRGAQEIDASDPVLAADPTGHKMLSTERLKEWSEEGRVQFHCAAEPADAWGGLIVTSGRFRFDATFPTLLYLARANLREMVFQILSKGRT